MALGFGFGPNLLLRKKCGGLKIQLESLVVSHLHQGSSSLLRVVQGPLLRKHKKGLGLEVTTWQTALQQAQLITTKCQRVEPKLALLVTTFQI